MQVNRSKSNRLFSLIWVSAILIGAFVFGAAALLLNQDHPAAVLKPEVSVKEAAALRDAGAFILDVRQPDEWADYHVPGSTLIPLDQLPNRLAEVPQDQTVVVVCRSGNRSQVGRDILLQAGYTQVTSLSGGLSTWRSLGYPTISGN